MRASDEQYAGPPYRPPQSKPTSTALTVPPYGKRQLSKEHHRAHHRAPMPDPDYHEPNERKEHAT